MNAKIRVPDCLRAEMFRECSGGVICDSFTVRNGKLCSSRVLVILFRNCRIGNAS